MCFHYTLSAGKIAKLRAGVGAAAAAKGTPISRSAEGSCDRPIAASGGNPAHGTADNSCASATLNYRVAREFSGIWKSRLSTPLAGRHGRAACPSALRAAKGTPIVPPLTGLQAARSAEGSCDLPIAALLAGYGNPASLQRHGRAACPSALRAAKGTPIVPIG